MAALAGASPPVQSIWSRPVQHLVSTVAAVRAGHAAQQECLLSASGRRTYGALAASGVRRSTTQIITVTS
jgi:hypothetical protein